jgi:hypothetical protein
MKLDDLLAKDDEIQIQGDELGCGFHYESLPSVR